MRTTRKRRNTKARMNRKPPRRAPRGARKPPQKKSSRRPAKRAARAESQTPAAHSATPRRRYDLPAYPDHFSAETVRLLHRADRLIAEIERFRAGASS